MPAVPYRRARLVTSAALQPGLPSADFARTVGSEWDPGDMCRNIRTLHNFEPPATSEEVHAAALQYVRKISGTAKPSQANQVVFDRAVSAIARVSADLLAGLTTTAAAKDRQIEATKARARSAERFPRH